MHRQFLNLLVFLAFVTASVAAPACLQNMMATVHHTDSMTHVSETTTCCEEAGNCEGGKGCDTEDGLCYLVCSGMKTSLVHEQVSPGFAFASAGWVLSEMPSLEGLGPERNDRPPDRFPL